MNQRDLDARTRIPSYAWSGIESILLGDEINVTCEQKHNEENSTHHLKNIRESMSVSGTSLQRYSQLRCGSCARLDDSQARRRRHSRRRIGKTSAGIFRGSETCEDIKANWEEGKKDGRKVIDSELPKVSDQFPKRTDNFQVS